MAKFFTKIVQATLQKNLGSALNVVRALSFETVTSASQTIKFVPQLSKIENNWIYQKNEDIKTPFDSAYRIEIPKNLIIPLIENPSHKEIIIETPPANDDNQIEAARMIVIRRQKMKNHKLKKLRKKLKFVRAKIRQKRELKKEKEFQEVLIQQCKTAEIFSAEEYVQSRIQKYQEALSYVPKVASTHTK